MRSSSVIENRQSVKEPTASSSDLATENQYVVDNASDQRLTLNLDRNGMPDEKSKGALLELLRKGSSVAEQDSKLANPIRANWKFRGLKEANAERPPIRYIVDQLFAEGSLSIVYGAPGSMKSMLLADALVCVASGQKWLTPLPTEESGNGRTFNVSQAPVMWIDYDNGTRLTDDRFDALSRARDLQDDTPIHYISMSEPWLDANDGWMMRSLAEVVVEMGVKIVVIDNLGLISGDADENSSDMSKVMGNLRRLAEETKSAIIVIHHQRKGGGADRMGDLLRGHSSIEAALDLALLIVRDGQSQTITAIPTKVRGSQIAVPFCAEFTYQHKPGTRDMQSARFWAAQAESENDKENKEIAAAVMMVVAGSEKDGSKLNKGAVVDATAEKLATRGRKIGVLKIRGVVDELKQNGRLTVEKGEKNAEFYRISQISVL